MTLTGTSQVEWDTSGEAQRSRYSGDIVISDLSSAFRQWGLASSVEGKDLKLKASLSWDGSPAMVDLYNATGSVEILEGSGRFVQAESGTGALRVLGIFDFASLARRFRFDFSDVVSSGFSFSELRGRVRLDKGMLRVVDPIVIVGSGSTFKVGGTVDLETTELDNDMIVTLPVSRNLPWYAAYSAIATGPLVGAGVWLAQKVFENQIDQMSSAKYKIEGTIDEPQVEFVSIFSDTVRESPDEDAKPMGEESKQGGAASDSGSAGETPQ
ncbi:MAG: AsmA-like C-terminal region-containing protein [Gammaproteobacteria bacterium]|nr:AsmA-like C-terminal region-containing protein [Gammaproteobacteria bacterium]